MNVDDIRKYGFLVLQNSTVAMINSYKFHVSMRKHLRSIIHILVVSEGFPTQPLGSQGWIDIVDLSIARKPERRTSPHEPRTQAADPPPQPQKPKTGLKSDPLGLLDRLHSRGDMVIVIKGSLGGETSVLRTFRMSRK